MVKRKTIGYIEVILAIVLFVGAIVGGILAFNYVINFASDINGIWGRFPSQSELSQFSNETRVIISFNYADKILDAQWNVLNLVILIICSAIILGAISLLIFFDGINKFNLQAK